MSELLVNVESLGLSNIVVGLSFLACIISLFVLVRGHQKTQKLNQKLIRLEHDLRVANGSAIGMGQQLIAMEKKLNNSPVGDLQKNEVFSQSKAYHAQNDMQKEKMAANNKMSKSHSANVSDAGDLESGASIYDKARQSLSQGLDVSDVAKQCGLSFAEVSLLKSLSSRVAPSH